MTNIYLHGILKKEYGDSFKGKIRRPKEAMEFIDANREGFIHRIVELSRQGIHYSVIVDGQEATKEMTKSTKEPKEVHLVPMLCGAGPVVGPIVSFFSGLSVIGKAVVYFAVTAASLYISSLLAPKPDIDAPEGTVAGAEESFIFSNKVNVAKQGIPVPVGYGRLRVGSAVIQSTLKSFPSHANIFANLTSAIGDGVEDYNILFDEENKFTSTSSTTKTAYGFDIYSEIRDSVNNYSSVSAGQEEAINNFVAEGIENDWWEKVHIANVFTWASEPMNVIDWVNQQTGLAGTSDMTNAGYAAGTNNSDGFFEHQYSGGGSLTLDKINNDGVEYNDCFLAAAVVNEWGTADNDNLWLGHHDTDLSTYFSMYADSGDGKLYVGNANSPTGCGDVTISSQKGVWVSTRSGDNYMVARVSGVVAEALDSGQFAGAKTFNGETGKFLSLGMGSVSDIKGSGGALSHIAGVAAGRALTTGQAYNFGRAFRTLCNNLGASIV